MLMIWHMEHRHTGATCFSGDEAKKALWDQAIESAKENGVTVLQFLVNASAHRFFFVIEAPDYDSIEETFGRCKTLGELEITPVRNWWFSMIFTVIEARLFYKVLGLLIYIKTTVAPKCFSYFWKHLSASQPYSHLQDSKDWFNKNYPCNIINWVAAITKYTKSNITLKTGSGADSTETP